MPSHADAPASASARADETPDLLAKHCGVPKVRAPGDTVPDTPPDWTKFHDFIRALARAAARADFIAENEKNAASAKGE